MMGMISGLCEGAGVDAVGAEETVGALVDGFAVENLDKVDDDLDELVDEEIVEDVDNVVVVSVGPAVVVEVRAGSVDWLGSGSARFLKLGVCFKKKMTYASSVRRGRRFCVKSFQQACHGYIH